MTRYKGRQNAKAVERDFPHFVDIVVPLGGLGSKLDAMYDFHTRHGVKAQRGHGRHDANGAVIRWCFADPALATTFASQFINDKWHETMAKVIKVEKIQTRAASAR